LQDFEEGVQNILIMMPTMTMSRRCTTFLVLIAALMTCCSCFQVKVPSLVMRRAPGTGSNRNVVRMATETDEAEKKSADPISVNMTDLEVPKFDSSDFEETKTSPGFDWFTP
jgi:hypothetical protein